MPEREGDPTLDRLEPLVGEWSLEAGPPDAPPWEAEASASFEWMKGRLFMIERLSISLPEFPDGVCVIGVGDEPGSFRQYYFDSRGVHRVYEMTLEDGVWTLSRDDPDPFPQRFTGRFEDDGRTIDGRWEKKEASNWEVDFNLTYRRKG